MMMIPPVRYISGFYVMVNDKSGKLNVIIALWECDILRDSRENQSLSDRQRTATLSARQAPHQS